ncbi:MAG: hypothetical protein QM661_15620 [Solimonas sp.]
MRFIAFALAAFTSTTYAADNIPTIARDGLIKSFEQLGENVFQNFTGTAPQWYTVNGKDKDACLRDTHGALNRAYILCRNGYRALARKDLNGKITVLQVENLPNSRSVNTLPSRGFKQPSTSVK